MRALKTEHLVSAAVAAAIAALALAEGGFEPTAYALLALLAWSGVVVGLAVGRLPRAEPPGAAIAAGVCLAAFAGLAALSIAWASDNGRAFEDVVRALAYLGAFVLVVVGSRVAEAAPWLRGLALGLVAIAVIALLARYVPGPFGDPDADLRRTVPATAGRLTYPIGYWNGLAAAMAAAIVLLAWFGDRARGRPGRALAIGALPPVVLALWATDSRGGIVAAALAFAVLIAASPGRPRLVANLALGIGGGVLLIAFADAREHLFEQPGTPAAEDEAAAMLVLTIAVTVACGAARYLLDRPLGRLSVPPAVGRATVAVVAIAAVVGVIAADPAQRFEEFKSPPTGYELSHSERPDLLRSGGSGRYQFWGAAVDGFAEAPVAGQGSGDYGPYWLEHREQPLVATRAHSLLFETLAELGVVGVATLLGFFAIATVAGVRRLRDAATGGAPAALAVLTVGVAAVTVDWTWDLPAVFVSTVLAVALLTGPATLAAGEDRGPGAAVGTARSRRRFAAGIALLLVAWASICAAGLLILADHSLETSRDRASRDDLAGAIEAADNAADIQPWAAEPRTQLALLYERGGDLRDALTEVSEAIERSPRDYTLYLLQARLLAVSGNTAAARESVARAGALNPLEPVVREAARSLELLRRAQEGSSTSGASGSRSASQR